ncbi:hypothetical protein M378DRAFT_17225 [Amanita muscaria Koide BX008]|uniref:Uncharacterized protein n=1 Tax=Amanita muscaria (strain Koide BX008) TaxID=946122 RepID=A0A0C2WI10_AMAMK|nr:hypothetical protein M378DRAFT_17225 [Amanita muscaria Koide BX008]
MTSNTLKAPRPEHLRTAVANSAVLNVQNDQLVQSLQRSKLLCIDAHISRQHQENGNIRSGHSSHFGKWSERSERSALESGRTTYLRSVKTLGEWFNLFESRPSALKAPCAEGDEQKLKRALAFWYTVTYMGTWSFRSPLSPPGSTSPSSPLPYDLTAKRPCSVSTQTVPNKTAAQKPPQLKLLIDDNDSPVEATSHLQPAASKKGYNALSALC